MGADKKNAMLRVLVAEDDQMLNMIISKKVKERGMEALSCHHGKEVVEILEREKPDLMMLDYNLSDMNAQQLIDIMGSRNHPLPPFVIMTGAGDEKTAVSMMKAGARDYIIKEQNFLELIPIVLLQAEEDIKKAQILDKTVERLSETESRFRTVWEISEVGMFLLDRESSKIVDVNKKGASLLGLSKERVLGLSASDIFRIDEEKDSTEGEPRLREYGQRETLLCTADNRILDILSNAVSFRMGDKEYVLVSFMDISEKKRQEKSKEETLRYAIRKEAESSALLAATKSILENRYFHQMAKHILAQIVQLTESIHGVVYLIEPDGSLKEMVFPRSEQQSVGLFLGKISRGDELEKLRRETVRNLKPVILNGVSALEKGQDHFSFLMVPLIYENKALGVMEIVFQNRNVCDDELRLVMAFSELVSIGLWNTRTRESLLESENSLREIKEKLSRSMEAGGLAWWSMDVATGKVEFDQRKALMLGFTQEDLPELNTKDLTELIHPEDRLATVHAMREHLEGRSTQYEVDYRIRKKDGTYAWFHDKGLVTQRAPDGYPRLVTGIVTDITKRKEAEEALIKNESRMKNLLEISQYVPRNSHDFLDYSLVKAIELTESEIGFISLYEESSKTFTLSTWSKQVFDLYAAEIGAGGNGMENAKLWETTILQRKPVLINEIVHEGHFKDGFPEGHVQLEKILSVPVFSGEKIVALVCVANKRSDYTDLDVYQLTLLMENAWRMREKMESEKRLKESEEGFRTFFENEPSYCFIIDHEGAVMDANKAVLGGLGYSLDEIRGNNVSFLEPDGIVGGFDEIRRLCDEQKKLENREITVRAHNGSKQTVLLSAALVQKQESDGVQYILTMRDITELRNTEMILQQSQKLESLGQLASGIAHEINTPTQYIGDNMVFLKDAVGKIRTFVETLYSLVGQSGTELQGEMVAGIEEARKKLDLDYLLEEIPKAVDETLGGARKVSEIVRSMKDFSHPGREMSKLDLGNAINSTVTISHNLWKYFSDITTEISPELPQVQCIGGEINQVLLNVIVNATHAIEDKFAGTGEKGRIVIRAYQEGTSAVISISDNGKGIPEEVLPKIFDPFFTTKKVGRGTGQGLYLAHKTIVQTHHGQILVDSKVGEGTTFTIRLPLQQEVLS